MPCFDREKRSLPVPKATEKAKHATAHLRKTRALRASGVIGRNEKLPFQREETPPRPSPYKRKVDDLDDDNDDDDGDDDHVEVKKKKQKTDKGLQQENVAQPVLPRIPKRSVNLTLDKPLQSSLKRQRESDKADETASKKPKTTEPKARDVKQPSNKPAVSPVQVQKSKDTAGVKPPSDTPVISSGKNQATERVRKANTTIQKPRERMGWWKQAYAHLDVGRPPAPAQKRKSDDEAKDSRKKAKSNMPAKDPETTRTSRPTRHPPKGKTYNSAATDTGKPRGLLNYKNASFANAVLQCLAGCEDLVEHYEPMHNKAMSEKDLWGDYPLADATGQRGRNGDQCRELLRKTLFNKLNRINIGAQLGQVFTRLQKPSEVGKSDEENAVNPIEFSQMFGLKSRRTSRGKRFDGETSEDCGEFLEELMAHLDREDRPKVGDKSKVESTVRQLFGGDMVDITKCDYCEETAEQARKPFSTLNLGVQMDPTGSSQAKKNLAKLSMPQILGAFFGEVPHEKARCAGCGRTGRVRKQKRFGANLPKYLAINTDCVEYDGSKKTIPIEMPLQTQYLGGYLHNPPADKAPQNTTAKSNGAAGDDTKKAAGYYAKPTTGYKLFAMVEHKGSPVNGGHYIAVRRTPQGWYQCKDHKITKLHKDSDKWRDNHQDGVLFFFKRIDS